MNGAFEDFYSLKIDELVSHYVGEEAIHSTYYVVLRGVSHDGCHRRFHSALKSDRERSEHRRVGGVGTSFFSPYNFFPQYNTTTYKGKTTIQYTVHLARKKNLLFKIQWSWQTPIIARFVWKGKVTDTYFSVAILTQTMLILALRLLTLK